jgi:hypothetical protein
MKKKWPIVVCFLLVQVLVGGLLLIGASEEFSGDHFRRFFGMTMSYIGLLVGFLILAQLLYAFSEDKVYRAAFSVSRGFTVALWILAFPIGINISEYIPTIDFGYSRRKAEQNSEAALTLLLDRLGLPRCASPGNCEVQFKNGERFILTMQGDYLKASCSIDALQRNDTLLWISLLQKKANYFLPVNKRQNPDSIEKARGKFYFRYDQITDHLYLGINTIYGIYYINSNGNFHMTIPIKPF